MAAYNSQYYTAQINGGGVGGGNTMPVYASRYVMHDYSSVDQLMLTNTDISALAGFSAESRVLQIELININGEPIELKAIAGALAKTTLNTVGASRKWGDVSQLKGVGDFMIISNQGSVFTINATIYGVI